MAFARFAFRSLARRPAISALLALSLGLAFGVPGAVRSVVTAFERELTDRAAAAPLVLGAPGSRSDLVLHALYFRSAAPDTIDVEAWKAFDRQGLAEAAPLCVTATARGIPVVGTNGNYFRLRGLLLGQGKPLARIGDCVLGAEAASRLGLGLGDHLATDPENLFSRTGAVPVRLNVVGVLARSGSADDSAAFVSLKTAWLVQGLGHGHANSGSKHEHESGSKGDASGGFVEVTDANVRSFHFHGDKNRFPLTGVIVRPKGEKARLLLLGRYLRIDSVQLAEADRVVRALLDVAVRLRRLFEVNAAVTSLATIFLCVAVVALTIRLRWAEVRTMSRIGLSRERIAALFGSEFAIVGAVAVLVATGLTVVASGCAPLLFRWLVL